MPPDCEKCRACIANPETVRYNKATKNKGGCEMDDNNVKVEPVPYIVHEADMARQERTIKRLWIALLVCLVIIAGMFVYEAQFTDEVITQEVEQEADNGINRFIGGDYYGTAEGENYYQTPNP